MTIAIIGGSLQDYNVLDQKLNELIEEKQCYLFYVVCGGRSSVGYKPGLSETWARQNGAPVHYIFEENFNKLQYKIMAAADYIIFILRDEQWIKNFIMRFKETGKHGTVITIKE